VSWLGFAAPLWLAGLAALVVPFVIHWLSRGRQRRVRIGSVRWLAEAETLRARRIRPSRLWLLLVRCLLIAQVVAALALPRLAVEGAGGTAEWLLVAPEVALERGQLEPHNTEAYRQLDERLDEGGVVHWLKAEIPRGEIESPPAPSPGDVWSWLQEAHSSAPPAVRFAVFALDREVDLRGARPALSRAVDWTDVTDSRPNRWIERAIAVEEEDLVLFVGTSDSASTRFERLRVSAEGPASTSPTAIEAERRGGRWRVALTEGGVLAADDAIEIATPVPETEVRILFAAERAEDARYVRTALEAVREVASLPLAIQADVVDPDAAVRPNAALTDILFWLSPEPLPPALREILRPGGIVVSDSLDRFEACDCPVPVTPTSSVRFDRTGPVEASPGPSVALWRDASGHAVLEAERFDDGAWLRYHSRFHPGFTDLVLREAFPQWLLEVVQWVSTPAPSSSTASSDRRAASGQAAPRPAVDEGSRGRESPLPLEGWLWLAAIAAASVERWLAARSVA
jgi:hypothetical protein